MRFKVSERTSAAVLSLMVATNLTALGYMTYEKYVVGRDLTIEGRESLKYSSLIYGKDTMEREEDKDLKEEDFYKPRLTVRQQAALQKAAEEGINK